MEHRQDGSPPPEITFLTQDEVRRLFAVIPGKRDRALFQLAYHHGLRASEVSLLQREDVHEKQGRIDIPRVKGSIAKTYPLQPEDVRLVRAYLRTRKDDSPYLFISTRGIPLERTPIILGLDAEIWEAGHMAKSEAAFSCVTPRDRRASA
jgi:integrase